MVSKDDRKAYEEGREHREHPGAGFIVNLVTPWRHTDSEHEAYEKGRDGEQLDDDKKENDSGGCYLTTACVNSVGLSNDCLELQVLRRFRDKVLMQDPKGKRAVGEYYRVAPEIVNAVNAQRNSEEIWKSTYRNIQQAVSLVLSGDFENAFRHYQKMTLDLKKRVLG